MKNIGLIKCKFSIGIFLLFTFLLSNSDLAAQVELRSWVQGTIRDAGDNHLLTMVVVYEEETGQVVETDDKGKFRLKVPHDKELQLEISRLGYESTVINLQAITYEDTQVVDVYLVPVDSGLEVIVRQKRSSDHTILVERGEAMEYLPTVSGNIETALPMIALGTSAGTGGELSSQYNVRGGNFDENLIYLNGFKVYRPQLVQQGQQEGLSMLNPDLVGTLSFSSGGFEARYGDKMSSVLDIQYKRPDSLKASIDASLLGGAAHLEGSVKSKKRVDRGFQYLVGARYKTTAYLLNTLDVEGEYVPKFLDLQAYLRYDLNKNWSADLLLNFNNSDYKFIPRSQVTSFGMINETLRLSTSYAGQENDIFTTRLAGLSFTYVPENSDKYFLKFFTTYQDSYESVAYDILGSYRLSQIEIDIEKNTEEEVAVLGAGVQHKYARNMLNFATVDIGHSGGYEIENIGGESHFLQWGADVEYQAFVSRMNEWERLDSALYSLPVDPDELLLHRVQKSSNSPEVFNVSAYVQDNWSQLTQMGEMNVNLGVRANYRSLNRETLISPRGQINLRPIHWHRDMSFRFSTGLYSQPAFYREMLRPDGSLNTSVKAQRSAHFALGWTYDFTLGTAFPERFKLVAEAYYKDLWNLVSYEIDNVRISYSGENDAVGNVIGLDLRLNGEFVKGAESWINVSFLRARESLLGVQHMKREIGSEEGVNVKSVPRPTDHFFNFSMFFQDYIPGNENIRAHVLFTLATGMPYGLEGNNEIYRNPYRYKMYNRMDVGFSFLLWHEGMRKKQPMHPLRFTRKFWLGVEVYNLMDIQNEASSTWIKTVFMRHYRVPNYLTSRRFNLRLIVDF